MPIIGKRDVLLPLVSSTAQSFKIPVMLLDAIVCQESTYMPWRVKYEAGHTSNIIPSAYAYSTGIDVPTEAQLLKFSWGLCQVMGSTARGLGYRAIMTQLLEPKTNLTFGARYLAQLMQRWPNKLEDVIAAYNWGHPEIKDGKYANQAYVDSVLNWMEKVKK